MGVENKSIIDAMQRRPGMYEPVGIPEFGPESLELELVEKIVTLPSSDRNYPFDRPFESYFAKSKQYVDKYVLARVLIQDGRWKNLRFLTENFVPDGEVVDAAVEELRQDLQVRVREELVRRGDPKEKKQATDDLRDFAKQVAEGKTLDAQGFRKLIGLFDGSSVVDILYGTRPEFRGIPADDVRGIIAEYLGYVLSVKPPFNIDDIELTAPHLKNQKLQIALYYALKQHFITYYNIERRRGNKSQPIPELVDAYFEILNLTIAEIDDPLVTEVAKKVKNYYHSLSRDLHKPPHMVEKLKEGRDFFDISQLINIQEIADNKRMAIGDEMGLGKSASVVGAKEILGLGCALITAPSNVIPTWLDYLSDKVDENGKQIGYFRPGMAPRVLVIENGVHAEDIDPNKYDYVLLSHERLNDYYTSIVEHVPFAMVIVDEVHKLKNLRDGTWCSNLLRIDEQAQQRGVYLAVLSGTPTPNKVIDVALLYRLLYPEEFKDVSDKALIRMIIQNDITKLRGLLMPRLQMKNLQESIEIPPLSDEFVFLEMSDDEKKAYEVLHEEDELTPTEKIKVLRQFLLNPDLLDMTPGIESTKIKEVGKHLKKVFSEKDKVVMFVNDYIENIIRGEQSIIQKMQLPENVEVRVIHGKNRAKRAKIVEEFNTTDRKVLLVVSGDTADVGIDLSAGEEVVFYNEPWTEYDRRQQLGRVYREGIAHPLRSTTFIVRSSIEEGIHRYIQLKYQAIEKLLRGVPLSQSEQELLERTEQQADQNLEVNPELAKYYFSAFDKMLHIFGKVKEIGETKFTEFLSEYGKDYADCYTELGGRSYQANACRVSGAIIDALATLNAQDSASLQILDIASGPEMLRRHIAEGYQNGVVSLDINAHHFAGAGGKRVIGSFLKLPVVSNSCDYANLSLALHYSKFIPSKGIFERLAVMTEMNRVLKLGGKAVINLIYSLELKDIEKFKELMPILGFRVVDEFTGEVDVSGRYKSTVITLEKVNDLDLASLRKEDEDEDKIDYTVLIERFAERLTRDQREGLKMRETGASVKDPRRIVKEFTVHGQQLVINLNEEDYELLKEEEEVIAQGGELKKTYEKVEKIPAAAIIENGFVRIRVKNRYFLFKKLERGNGVVVIK